MARNQSGGFGGKMPKGGGKAMNLSRGQGDTFAGRGNRVNKQPTIPGDRMSTGGMQAKPAREVIKTSGKRQARPTGESF